MTLFVDVSALIAIINGELDADVLSDRLEADPGQLCSADSLWEMIAARVRSDRFCLAAIQRR